MVMYVYHCWSSVSLSICLVHHLSVLHMDYLVVCLLNSTPMWSFSSSTWRKCTCRESEVACEFVGVRMRNWRDYSSVYTESKYFLGFRATFMTFSLLWGGNELWFTPPAASTVLFICVRVVAFLRFVQQWRFLRVHFNTYLSQSCVN